GLVPERTDRLKDGNPTFGWPTQTVVDVLDLPPQIVIQRGMKEAAWRDTHGHHDAGCRTRGSQPSRRNCDSVARDRAGRGRDRQRGRNAALRVRWPDGVPAAADGRGAARHHRAGLKGPEILL